MSAPHPVTAISSLQRSDFSGEAQRKAIETGELLERIERLEKTGGETVH